MTYMSFAQVSIPGFHSHEVTLPLKSCFGNHGCRSHGKLGTFWRICASKHLHHHPQVSTNNEKHTPKTFCKKTKQTYVLEDFAGKRRILRGPSAHVTAQGPTKHGCADSHPHLPNRGWFNDWWCSPSIQHFWGSLDFSDILEDKNNYLVVYHQEFLWIFPLNQGVTKPGCHLESSFPGGMELLEGGPK